MDWEQKLQALNVVAECVLKMRKPGDWFVSQPIDVKQQSILVGMYGNGATPQAAVEDHWTQLTTLPADEYIVSRYGDMGTRTAVRWNGFMWDRVVEKAVA